MRTGFSGKAADRFADGLGIFDGLLSSGQGSLLDLAVFVRKTSQQVRYLKLMTIYSLELLWLEMAWAMRFAGATGGATLLWLAARMAAMRVWLTTWWGQLFMRLAMMAAGGVAFNVVPDVQAQAQMLGEKSARKWDGTLTEQAAGMGAFSALVALPLSAVGGLVSNTLTKVLVKGLGDDVDAAILEAAAKKAVAEHAELYPVSAMAKFADVVAEHLDDYAGMSVRAMWLARFGSGLGDALAGSLSELFGEVAYAAAAGLPLTWNPYSLTAGGFETVFSGLGTLAGLALRGKLHPQGPSPYLEGTGRGGDGSDDGGGSGEEKTPPPGIGSGSQTGNIPGSPDKDDSTFVPSDASRSDGSRSDRWTGSDFSNVSDVDSVFSDTGSVDSAAVPVPSGKDLVVSAVVDGKDSKDVQDGTHVKGGKEGAGGGGKGGADDGTPGETPARGVPAVPGSGQHQPGTPPPAYSGEVTGFGPDRPGTPPPPYSPGPGDDQAVPGLHGVTGKSDVDVPGMIGVSSVDASSVDVSGVDGSGVSGGRSLDVLASQTTDSAGERSSAGIRPGSGVSSDAVFPETVTPGAGPGVGADPDGGAGSGGRESLPGAVTGEGGSFGVDVDVVVGRGDSHRQGGVVVSEGSAVLPVEGVVRSRGRRRGRAQAVSSLRKDGVAAWPEGLPVDAVRVLVPAEVVAGGGLAEFVQGVADSPGGPVLLVSQGDPTAGVVVTRGQGSALARDLGRHVVAMMPGQAGREPRWTVFPADGSRPKPLAGPGAAVLAGGRSGGVAGLADASATVLASAGGETVAGGEASAAQRASAQARSVVGYPRPGATTHAGQAGTGLPGPRSASWREQDLRRVDATAVEEESGDSGAVPWSADPVAVAQVAGMSSGADSAGVVERGLESMAGQLQRSSPVRGAGWSGGAGPGGAVVQPRRGGSRVAEQPGRASPGGEATGEGARRTSADPAAGVGRRRAWPGGVSANQARPAGNEPGGAGPKRAPEHVVGPDVVGPDAVGRDSGVWGVSDPVAEGGWVGSGYRFLSGVNQANYRCGDEGFRVNCLEAVVAFHNSVKFGRQFVAGPAVGDRDPARLEVAFGARARPVAGVAGVEWYVRVGWWVWLCR
ncbi:hypothetical protein [Saccharopolyspora sp. ASAGF58]|uniref:hypothetical protein n=1 Tax=Saccharopolyspora sp. ASAGF58 TaxID=2719023 RepID=UPI001445B0C7|nr:hypothetical protein [Saccharopolyspora sp. ASAGF58]